jgi:hypothetical protein
MFSISPIYERLPDDVQSELSVREFVGVVERLRDARLLVVGTGGVKLQHPGAANGSSSTDADDIPASATC